MTFEEAIKPVGLKTFDEQTLDRHFLLLTGRPGHFRDLVGWQEIANAMQHGRWSDGQLRLVQNGRFIDPRNYRYLKVLQAARLRQYLDEGATLTLSGADEVFPNVRTLAQSCEEHFRIAVSANVYAGWRTDNGFDLHWDRHDTLICQVAGRKRWTVYEPTQAHPLDDSPSGEPPRPEGPPVWDGILEDGDLLYMPRGWWHVARPVGEATLHLTFGLQHPIGAELLKWLAGELRTHVEARTSVPHLQGAEARRQYIERLRQLISERLTPEVVEQFMQAAEKRLPVRPIVTLPQSAGKSVAIRQDTAICLLTERRLFFECLEDEGVISFHTGDREWKCEKALLPALSLLRAARPTTLQEMMNTVAPVSRARVYAIVLEMLARGAIWIQASAEARAGAASVTV